jgi:predicted Rossmann fold flavoprotein
LMPSVPADRLDRQLVSAAARHGRKSFRGMISQVLPERLAAAVIQLAGGDPDTQSSQMTAKQRQGIVAVIKRCPVTITGTRGFDEAMVTIGGVATRDVDPVRMESRLVPGLYFCGEVLDLDGPCGGYNLQIAWTTGFAAGSAAGFAEGSAVGHVSEARK